jgi:hypothetical protein
MKRPIVAESKRSRRRDSIPMFGGRPVRQTIINEEDIVNLRIALNTSKSWEDFLSQL